MAVLPAQMSNSGGRWHLYVPLLNVPVSLWPAHEWPPATPVPTLAERERVLDALGYSIPAQDEWSWTEDSDIPGDPATRVRLIATVTVRPVAGSMR